LLNAGIANNSSTFSIVDKDEFLNFSAYFAAGKSALEVPPVNQVIGSASKKAAILI
jgi:hypothetical protein